jgi:hypothetical protein
MWYASWATSAHQAHHQIRGLETLGFAGETLAPAASLSAKDAPPLTALQHLIEAQSHGSASSPNF